MPPVVERGAVRYAIPEIEGELNGVGYSEAVISWNEEGVEIAFDTPKGSAYLQFRIGSPDALRKADHEKESRSDRLGWGQTPRLPFEGVEGVAP